MISAIEFKKYIAGVGILGVIIGKLYHKKKLCLIILLKVDKDLEVSFHCAILPFGLTVCLWIKGGEESPLDAKKIV